MIPVTIPERLRKDAIWLELDREDQPAWSASEALEVIASLEGSNIAVVAVQPYCSISTGLAATVDSWTCDPLAGETTTEFAQRSWSGARDFINGIGENVASVFAIAFYSPEDAA